MKRRITASNSIDLDEATKLFVELLDNELIKTKYTVTGIGTLPNVKLKVDYTGSESDKMPKIKFEVVEFEAGNYGVIPTLTFPSLTVGDNDFSDTIQYWIEQWADMSRFISKINKFSFNPKDYLE